MARDQLGSGLHRQVGEMRRRFESSYAYVSIWYDVENWRGGIRDGPGVEADRVHDEQCLHRPGTQQGMQQRSSSCTSRRRSCSWRGYLSTWALPRNMQRTGDPEDGGFDRESLVPADGCKQVVVTRNVMSTGHRRIPSGDCRRRWQVQPRRNADGGQ